MERRSAGVGVRGSPAQSGVDAWCAQGQEGRWHGMVRVQARLGLARRGSPAQRLCRVDARVRAACRVMATGQGGVRGAVERGSGHWGGGEAT